MTKLLIYGFLIYLLYKLVFNVVLPVRKGVKTVRQNMEEMQRKMAEAQQQNANYSGFTKQNPPKAAPKPIPFWPRVASPAAIKALDKAARPRVPSPS